ncbi:hypothetical protein FQN54_005467 [Arachnomyces sp. PD_36]|nr:hypothetical protein FQN54_005467 [Arachnomyces sp. PD_36]
MAMGAKRHYAALKLSIIDEPCAVDVNSRVRHKKDDDIETTVSNGSLHKILDRSNGSHHNIDTAKYYLGFNLCGDLYDVLTEGGRELMTRAIHRDAWLEASRSLGGDAIDLDSEGGSFIAQASNAAAAANDPAATTL